MTDTPKKSNPIVVILCIVLIVAIVLAVVGFIGKDNALKENLGLNTVVEDVKAKLAEAEAGAADLGTQLSEKAAALETSLGELDVTKKAQAELETIKADLEKAKTDLETEVQNITASKGEVEKKLADVQAKLTEAEGKITELEGKIAEDKASYEALEKTAKENADKAAELEKKVAELEASLIAQITPEPTATPEVVDTVVTP